MNPDSGAPKGTSWQATFLTAIVMLGLSVALALPFNALRDQGIPLVATTSYDDRIFTECPDTEDAAGETRVAEVTRKGAGLVFPPGTLLIDASSPETFEKGHLPAAINIPYDEFGEVSEAALKQINSLNPKGIIVYCNGWEDETDPEARYPEMTPGSQVADDLISQGLTGVSYMKMAVETHLKEGGTLEGSEPSGRR